MIAGFLALLLQGERKRSEPLRAEVAAFAASLRAEVAAFAASLRAEVAAFAASLEGAEPEAPER